MRIEIVSESNVHHYYRITAMAKKRTTIRKKAFPVHSYEEADQVLRQVAVLKAQVSSSVAAYNQREQERRAKLTVEITPWQEQIAEMEEGLLRFASDRRDDFDKKKSRDLNHGTIGFRMNPPSIKAIKGVTLEAALKLVKASKHAWRFIRQKEEINRDEILTALAAKEISEAELTPLGLCKDQVEEFYYDLKLAAEDS
jgi:phage host-nuclease inhibitor protein Gam